MINALTGFIKKALVWLSILTCMLSSCQAIQSGKDHGLPEKWINSNITPAALLTSTPTDWNEPIPSKTPIPPKLLVPTATLPSLDFLKTPLATLSPGWTPSLPPVLLPGQSINSELPAYLNLAADLLTYTRGNLEEFTRLVENWGKIRSEIPGGAIWAQRVDLNGDGMPEVLSSLPLLQEIPPTDMPGYIGIDCLTVEDCPRLVAVFQPQETRFVPSGVLKWGDSPWLQAPQLLTVDDLDSDGKPEVVLKVTTLGMRNTDRIIFGRWDGNSWFQLLGNLNLSGNIPQVKFVTRPGLPGKAMEVSFDPFPVTWIYGRTHTRVYSWQSGGPQEIQDIPAPSDDPYFLLMDAHSALKSGQIDLGLALALQAFQPGSDPRFHVSLEQDRILSFAAIDAMLAYAVKGDFTDMQTILNELKADFAAEPNPYLLAAQQLMNVYQATHDAKLACQEMATVVRSDWKNASLLGFQMISTDSIAKEDICPFE